MSNAKHTPGPWEVDDRLITAQCSDDDGEYVEVVAQAHVPANARLIASAPELLAALERIAELSYDSEATRVAREAIAKARGE